ncbi:MAG: gamma-glutamyltransferase [Rhizobiaceae bacterium]
MRDFDLPGRSPVMATGGMAATSHPLATATALTILREGGNAVDAAIAASATLCVVEPHMTGIGGDCFAIVCEPDGTLHGLNGSGRAPKSAHLDWYLERGIDTIKENSVHSITCPGAVNAWEMLHQRFGACDFARLFADAVRHGREGFPVAPRVARDWKLLEGKLATDPGASLHYLNGGVSPQSGEIFRAPALADVMECIALEGAQAFYKGAIADEIASTVQMLGGFMTSEDLANVSADWVELISTRYRDHDVHEIPPNGQGITALILLNLLAETRGAQEGPTSAERYHREIEMARLAYAVRDAHVSDPAHMKVQVERLLSQQYTQALAGSFDPQQRNSSIRLPRLPASDTVYLSVVDRDLRAVSFINSVYDGFGSGIVTPKSGIALQNRGACFTLETGHPNAIGGGKRPMHTIIPAMVTRNGQVSHSMGVMGGAYQPMGHAHVLSNMLDHGMDPQEALDNPRIFWGDEGDALKAEAGIPDNVMDALSARGHAVSRGGLFGGGQIIHVDHERGVLTGGSDPRKDGHAAGF